MFGFFPFAAGTFAGYGPPGEVTVTSGETVPVTLDATTGVFQGT